MRLGPYRFPLGVLVVCSAAVAYQAVRADELSSNDELRALYSDRFAFTDDGLPLLTVEIMGGQDRATLAADAGLTVLPDGEGGAEIAGARGWTVTVEKARPGRIDEWTVVEHLDIDDARGVEAALTRWSERGYEPKTFEIGTVFGVDGEVIDSREVLIAVDPVAAGKAAARAHRIAKKWSIETQVHRELVRRPEGTLVATSDDGEIVVRNPSVLWFAPAKRDETVQVKDVVYGGGGSQLDAERKEDRRYWGQVYVTLDNDGKLVVVNAITADKLLAGLVPSEIFPDAPLHALAAQAIAARTELLSRIGTRHFTDPFLLCSSQHCQVYSGAGKEHPRTTEAIAKTRGKVLLRRTGGLVDARYSASCGGHSEHNENIWGGEADPSLRGALDTVASATKIARAFDRGVTDKNVREFLDTKPNDAYCGATRYARGRYRWTARVDAAELRARVEKEYGDVGAITALEPVLRGVSGRIRELRIRGTERTVVASGDLHIRRLLGGLKSALFVVSASGPKGAPREFVFEGAGFGHGVGMCQTGAIGRAEAGQTYQEILRHYYVDSRVQRLY